MAEYVNILNMHELTSAVRERNAIEKAKLEFEKEVFEFNKQLNIDNVKANVDMSQTISEYADIVRNMNESIKVLRDNDFFLNQKIDALKFLLESKAD